MKKTTITTIMATSLAAITIAAVAMASCTTSDVKNQTSSGDEIEISTKDLESAAGGIDPAYTLRTEEELKNSQEKDEEKYSSRTLIINLKEEATNESAFALASDYNMNVVYVYKIINACALSTKRDFTDEEMSYLMEKLKSDDRVISVERDALMRLD